MLKFILPVTWTNYVQIFSLRQSSGATIDTCLQKEKDIWVFSKLNSTEYIAFVENNF